MDVAFNDYKDKEKNLKKMFSILKENKNSNLVEFPKILEEFKKDGDEDEGPDLNYFDENNKSLLHYALESGDKELISLLLKNGADANIRNFHGETPLHFLVALKNGSSLIEYLLNEGAYIDSQTHGGSTPLHFACKFGNREAVEILLRRGANIRILTGEGYNLLHCCILMGKPRTLKNLLEKDIFKNFIEKRDFQDRTPLHLACELGEDLCAEILIKYGANLDAEDLNGYTPLQLACSSDSDEIVEIIMEVSNSILEKKNSKGQNAIDTANEFNSKKVMKLISKKLKEPEITK